MTAGEKNRKQQSTWLINVLIAVSKGGFICGSYDYVVIRVGTTSFTLEINCITFVVVGKFQLVGLLLFLQRSFMSWFSFSI